MYLLYTPDFPPHAAVVAPKEDIPVVETDPGVVEAHVAALRQVAVAVVVHRSAVRTFLRLLLQKWENIGNVSGLPIFCGSRIHLLYK